MGIVLETIFFVVYGLCANGGFAIATYPVKTLLFHEPGNHTEGPDSARYLKAV